MKRLSGFSLMEMMIVLTIVAIVAAASAPMINKKMVSSSAGASPWRTAGSGIAYNLSNENKPVIIGANDGVANARLNIRTNDSAPHLSFRSSAASSGEMLFYAGTKATVWLSTKGLKDNAKRSVVIGIDADTSSTSSVVIGDGAHTSSGSSAGTDDAIAIGRNATAAGSGIAIGSPNSNRSTQAQKGSIAIGDGAGAIFDNSVALGSNAVTTTTHQIVLGSPADTVYIPGNLVVSGVSYLGAGLDNSTGGCWFKSFGASGYLGIEGNDRYLHLSENASGNVKHGTAFAPNWVSNMVNSDRRLKNVGKSFQAGLAELKKLNFYNYTFKDDKDKTPRVGVMAQDLRKVFPDAVTKGEDGFLRIRMEDMFYAVINAVKELDLKTNANSKRIDELEKQNKELLKRLETLEKKI